MIREKVVFKWFKIAMTIVNSLFAIPVVWVLIRELVGPEPAKSGRVLAAVGLVAIPFCATLAITIAGSAVLGEK